MKILKKWVLRLWRILLWLPWVFAGTAFRIFGAILAFIYFLAGQKNYAKRVLEKLGYS